MSHIQEIVAILGHGVAGNPTQFVMERICEQARLDWRFLTLEVAPADLTDAVRGAQVMGFRGFSLSPEHQAAAAALVDRPSEPAALAGAVDCARRDGEQLIGELTLGVALANCLAPSFATAGKNVVLLGAGCLALQTAVCVAQAGAAQIIVANSDQADGQALVAQVQQQPGVAVRWQPWEGDYVIPPETELLINATPIGTSDATDRVPADLHGLEADMVVVDLAFNPDETRFARDARARGCTVVDGLALRVERLALAFNHWTGREADREAIGDAIDEFFGL